MNGRIPCFYCGKQLVRKEKIDISSSRYYGFNPVRMHKACAEQFDRDNNSTFGSVQSLIKKEMALD